MSGQWYLTCNSAVDWSEFEGADVIGADECPTGYLEFHKLPENPGVLPPLTGEDGATIGAAIIACWIAGFVARIIRRTLN